MKPQPNFLKSLLCTTAVVLVCAGAYGAETLEAPEHFRNPSENINPDPDYVPGGYELPDVSQALAYFEMTRNRFDDIEIKKGDKLFRAEKDGEISVTVMKNESAPVLAYFRDFDGYILFRQGIFSEAKLIISTNSWDSAVPARDNRVRAILFESMNTDKAFATLHLTHVGEAFADFEKLKEDGPHVIEAGGVLIIGGVMRPVRPTVEVDWSRGKWKVKSAKPLDVLISDFKLDGAVPSLMKECNHKSIGNKVSIEWELEFEKE